MVQEVQQTDGAESDSRASQVEASERLAVRCDELISRLEKALQATALSNRFLLPFRRLPEIAKAEADAFLDFMKTGEANRVRERGAKRAEEGLGERSMLRLGATLRQFWRDDPADKALQAADAYADTLLEGFMAGREAIVLREQEQIRKALQTVISRYALQLATAAEVSRTASSILDPAELLPQVVNLIRDRFNYYYVGLFLLDESREYAVLRAATGEAGRQMLELGHKLQVGGTSMIGWCTAHGKARIALDVGREAMRFDNPLLPETRSEMALPLISRGRVIGAMTIQSTRSAAFSEEDADGSQTMADQVANAIENARLFQQTEESLKEISRLHQSYLRHEWQEYLADEEVRARAGYVYERGTLKPAGDVWMPEISLAVQRGKTVALPEMAGALQESMAEVDVALQAPSVQAALAVPLTLRGQVIGALDLYETDQPRQWSQDDIALVESVADQVALAIENARAYAELQKTAEQLKEVDRLKSQFLANMSHELRTPLNSIIGFSRVILKGIDGPLTDMQRTDLQAVYDGGQHLLGLINDILDISKIEAGRMELAFENVDLAGIIKGVMSTAIALVKDKPIELQQSVPTDLPTIWGDSRRIRQVLLNLVSNATKFTEEGFIRVEAEAYPTEVIISVVDSGIGIPPDKLEVIFEPFTQADASTTRRVGGTGLGLSISKRLTEIHGGRIWVESTLDVGTTFYVTFPLKATSQSPEEAEAEQPEGEQENDHKVVLCVDDDEGVITLFRRYLSKKGYHVIGLTDSAAVVERAAQLAPFAITLDVMMPGKDGWQVIQELKADPNTHHIPVIVCTIVSEKEYGISLGAADYLVKPILEEELVAALERLDKTAGRHLVLVVDDQEDNRGLLRRMIEGQEGYEVVEAAGGQEAITLVRQIHPHVIILDLMMPEVDGFAVLEAVKSDKMTRSIPIIVVTAKDLTQEERDTLNMGVEVMLQKGLFEQQELLADVAAALERISGTDAA
jgi:signal transduction histidine kinase/DNA-binding response OmpR family regulator